MGNKNVNNAENLTLGRKLIADLHKVLEHTWDDALKSYCEAGDEPETHVFTSLVRLRDAAMFDDDEFPSPAPDIDDDVLGITRATGEAVDFGDDDDDDDDDDDFGDDDDDDDDEF